VCQPFAHRYLRLVHLFLLDVLHLYVEVKANRGILSDHLVPVIRITESPIQIAEESVDRTTNEELAVDAFAIDTVSCPETVG
jgi:hypothetical protein